MCSRVVSLVVSLMLLLSSMMASAPAIAASDPHPHSAVAVLAALAPAPGELPADDSASPDPADRLLDMPDQLEGPNALYGLPALAFRMEPQVAVSLNQPHLKGPQRPPRATGLPA